MNDGIKQQYQYREWCQDRHARSRGRIFGASRDFCASGLLLIIRRTCFWTQVFSILSVLYLAQNKDNPHTIFFLHRESEVVFLSFYFYLYLFFYRFLLLRVGFLVFMANADRMFLAADVVFWSRIRLQNFSISSSIVRWRIFIPGASLEFWSSIVLRSFCWLLL